jgi:hypothetical protein
MQIGDIVLLAGIQNKSQDIIKWQDKYSTLYSLVHFQKKLPYTPYSHVAMHIGNGVFIEAFRNEWNGVRLTTYHDLFDSSRSDGNFKVFRNKHFSYYEDEIFTKMQIPLETKYKMLKLPTNTTTFFCSQLIHSILKDVKHFDVFPEKDSIWVHPSHFYSTFIFNTNNYWKDVTDEYHLQPYSDYLLRRSSKNYIDKLYTTILAKIYNSGSIKEYLRYYELVHGKKFNFLALSDKENEGTATENELIILDMFTHSNSRKEAIQEKKELRQKQENRQNPISIEEMKKTTQFEKILQINNCNIQKYMVTNSIYQVSHKDIKNNFYIAKSNNDVLISIPLGELKKKYATETKADEIVNLKNKVTNEPTEDYSYTEFPDDSMYEDTLGFISLQFRLDILALKRNEISLDEESFSINNILTLTFKLDSYYFEDKLYLIQKYLNNQKNIFNLLLETPLD